MLITTRGRYRRISWLDTAAPATTPTEKGR